MSKKYSKYEKKNLVDKIQRIQNKSVHKDIKKIIIKHNPDIVTTKNSNGLFIHFNELEEKTYVAIRKYLTEYDKNSVKISDEIVSSSSDEDSDEEESDNYVPTKKKLKLTNVEQHLINQRKYKNNKLYNKI